MAGDRTQYSPKFNVNGNDVETKFNEFDLHVANADKHREINDAGVAATDLWSASKITTELSSKVDSPITPATDVPDDSITFSMLDTVSPPDGGTDGYCLVYNHLSVQLEYSDRVKPDGSNLEAESVAESNLDITTAAGVGVDGYCLVWDNAGGKLDYAERALVDLTNVADESIVEAMLDALDTPADTEVLGWNAGAGRFEWLTHTTGGAASYQVKMDAGGAAGYLEDFVPNPSTASGNELLKMDAGATGYELGPALEDISGNAGRSLVANATEDGYEHLTRLTRITTNTTLYIDPGGDDVTGDGSSGNPWESLAKCFSYLRDFFVDDGVLVTISVAGGTYTGMGAVSVDLPTSDRVRIFGDASAIYNFSGNGFTVAQGQSLNITTKSVLSVLTLRNVSSSNTIITLGVGSRLNITGFTVIGPADTGVYANPGSVISVASGSFTLNTCGSYGVILVNAIMNQSAGAVEASSCAYGIFATNCSMGYLLDCSLQSNTVGAYARYGSKLIATTWSLSGNGTDFNPTVSSGATQNFGNGGAVIWDV